MSFPYPAFPKVDGRRDSLRSPVNIPAEIRRAGGKRMPVRIVDLSASGFRMSTRLELGLGEKVFVHIPGLEAMTAIVRWSQGNGHGCKFGKPLYPAVAHHLITLFR